MDNQDGGWAMKHVECWMAAQGMSPIDPRQTGPGVEPLPYYESCWRGFLDALPKTPMSTEEFAKLAYFAGAVQTFQGLAQHQLDAAEIPMTDEQYNDALKEMTLEALEYLHARGIKLP